MTDRVQSTLPPIKNPEHNEKMSDFSKQRFMSPQVRKHGSIDDHSSFFSGKKSVFKLEPNADASPNNRHDSLDSMFRGLPEREKNEIVNRIHKLRFKTIEESLAGAMQESMLTSIEKDKVLEQYYHMKKQLNKAV
jgi:hypothetical protein